MIEQQGQVVEITGSEARVRLGGSSGCSACDAGKGCGAGVFGRLLQRRPVVLNLDNRVGAVNGQPVIVGLPESLFLNLLTRLYLFPLLAGLGGAVIGNYLGGRWAMSSWASDILTLFGALLCGAALIQWNRKRFMEFPANVTVHMLRVVDTHETGM
jgi:sigma-E factor negative regulatory protein RseC